MQYRSRCAGEAGAGGLAHVDKTLLNSVAVSLKKHLDGFQDSRHHNARHLLHHIVLIALCTNEITAIPELIKTFALQGAIFT